MHAHPPSHQCRCFQEDMKGPLHINTCFPCHKTNTLRYTTTKVSLVENEV